MTTPPTLQCWQVLHGDCLELMRSLADTSVEAVVTDPPYGLSFMGKRWDYDVPSVEIWAEALRVLKPGGHLLAFAGTRTQHRMAVRIEDAGFEIRDMIAWCYGSGFPKSHNLKDEWEGWGTALKPSLEPITVARKPFKGTVAQNVEKHGTGALNVDGCRVIGEDNHLQWEHGRGMGFHGAEDRGKCGSTEQVKGRWPANLLHDGSPEVVELFPLTNSWGKGFHASDGIGSGGIYGGGGIGTTTYNHGDTGSAARFFYCAKADKAERDDGLHNLPVTPPGARAGGRQEGSAGITAYAGTRGPAQNHHPTVKPVDLMRWLCRLVTPPDGLVLDPFTGSGSTGVAAALEGYRFIGMEQDATYCEIARRRIAAAYSQGRLEF